MSLIDVLIPSFKDSLGNILKTSLAVIMQETCKSLGFKEYKYDINEWFTLIYCVWARKFICLLKWSIL